MRKCCLYPTDLNDAQWELVKQMLPKAKKRGRPRTDRRQILNGLLHFVRAGCAWRLLPREFGPWPTVYGCFRALRQQGLWKHINEDLRRIVRREAGKRSQPTAGVLDSQTVRSADHSPADVSEKAATRGFLSQALAWFGWLRCIWADAAYAGEAFGAWVASHRRTGTLHLDIVSRLEGQRGFKVLARRWIVERTLGWFMKHRRLARDYETKLENAEAMIHLTMISVMLRRLR